MNKVIALAIGILAFTLILQIAQLSSTAIAHQNGQIQNGHTGMSERDHMSSHMSCMMGQMSGQTFSQMSLEEMDENNDGKCDMCGMPISECEEMREHMEEHEDGNEEWEGHHEMLQDHHGMSCHN